MSRPLAYDWASMDTALASAAAYPHAVDSVERRETHISVVYLAGPFAYKLKKPVELGVLDFRQLDTRRRLCEAEVWLNRRLAPRLYLGVEPIVFDGRTYRVGRVSGNEDVGKSGTVIDFVVKMRRFDENELLSCRIAARTLNATDVDRVAAHLASFHCTAPAAPADSHFGAPALLTEQIDTPLRELDVLLPGRRIASLRGACRRRIVQLAPHIQARRSAGFVRECHGDLHLGNIVASTEIACFDCIEFSAELRWIDVVNDIAFLVMDLGVHRRADLAARALNVWLAETGDYFGLPALPLYIAYRASVRAWVHAQRMRLPAAETGETPDVSAHTLLGAYLDAARRAIAPARPALLLCHGFSGSGKSAASDALATLIGAVRIDADRERKRAAVLHEASGTHLPAREYDPHARDLHYEQVRKLAAAALRGGISTIVDASFLCERHRRRFIELAYTLAIPVFILDFHAPRDRLVDRVRTRATQGAAAAMSDADEHVLAYQLEFADALTPQETALSLRFDTNVPRERFAAAAYWRALTDALASQCVHSALPRAAGEP